MAEWVNHRLLGGDINLAKRVLVATYILLQRQ